MNPEAPLKLAPALEVVPLGGDLLLASAMAALRLEGGVARLFREHLLEPLSEGATSRDLLARLPGVPQGDVERILRVLTESGLLIEVPVGSPPPPTWTHLVTADLEKRETLAHRLAEVRVAIFGAGGVGQGVAEILSEAGARDFLLVASTTEQTDDGSRTSTGIEGLRERWPDASYAVERGSLDRDRVPALVAGSDLILTAVDPSLSAVRLWVNQASIDSGIPSAHASVYGHRLTVGPLVLPGEGPCYLCWRMRALAAEDDFGVAMAREEALDRSRREPPEERPALPTLAPLAASLLGHEALAVLTGFAQPRLAGHVFVQDGFSLSGTFHPVIARPDCPACGKKGRRPLRDLSADTRAEPGKRPDTPFEEIAELVVSPVCGIVRALERVPKDVEEPEIPFIVRAELSNSRFLTGPHSFVGCSGKGVSLTRARHGAIGEALERYAALTWTPPRRVSATRADLDGPSLDPRDLVLFAEDQYSQLPYTPYHDDSEIEWVPARSLVTGSDVWVPLLATHLGYDPPTHAGRLFAATSNGFAAGRDEPDATLRALLEVIERDAFLMSWSHRLAGPRYPARAIPDEETRLIASAYARRGVDIDVILLPADSAAAVALAVGWSEDAPAAVVGLGASLDPVVAARGAVLEVAQVRPALRARLRQPDVKKRLAEFLDDPFRVSELEDHDLLFADPEIARTRLAYLRERDYEEWTAPPRPEGDPEADLAALVESLAGIAGDVLAVDVTPDDVAPLAVRVVRGIVPGFQPISFGAAELRLGGSRIYDFPARIGARSGPVAREELNLFPHPLS